MPLSRQHAIDCAAVSQDLYTAFNIPENLEENMTIIDWALHQQLTFTDPTDVKLLAVIKALQKIRCHCLGLKNLQNPTTDTLDEERAALAGSNGLPDEADRILQQNFRAGAVLQRQKLQQRRPTRRDN